MSLDTYLSELADANEAATLRASELETELDSQLAGASDQEAIDAYKEFFDASTGVVNGIVDEVEALDPPPEVEQADGDLVDGLKELRATYEDLVVDLDGVNTQTEAEELIGSAVAPAAEAGRAACLEIQAVADSNSIDVALEC